MQNTFNGATDFEKTVIAPIIRNGDLITKMYLRVELPEHTITSDPTKLWAWVSKLGHVLIQKAELNIGGTVIDKHYTDWLNIWYELARNFAHDRGYAQMIGNYSELTGLANTHPEAVLYVPLQFFFNRNDGLGLPIIALQYHDIRVSIDLRRLQDCLNYTNNVNFNSDLRTLKMVDASLYVDYIFLDADERGRFARNSHEYLIEQVQFTGDETLANTKFKLNFNHPCKALYWAVKLGKYTSGKRYLAYNPDSSEDMVLNGSARFVLRCARYDYTIPNAPTLFPSPGDNKVQPAVGLNATLLDIFNQLGARYFNVTDLTTGNLAFGNTLLDMTRLSIPIDVLFPVGFRSTTVDVVPTTSDGHESYDVVVRQWDNYGILLDRTGNTVVTGLLQLNGQDRFKEREGKYFNYVQPYQHHSNTPSDGINMYSFSLKPEDHQPSGTCNMSRIDSAILALTFAPGIASAENVLSIYATNYNVLRITSGMGGLAYSN